MDGLGLSMFIPLLELVGDEGQQVSTENMGGLSFIIEGIQSIGLSIILETVLFTLLVFFCLKGLFKWIEQFLFVINLQLFVSKLRIEGINNLTNYKYEEFVKTDAGVIQNSMTTEVQRVVQGYRMYSQMLQQISLLSTYIFLAFTSNPQFAILVAVAGTLTNILFNGFYKKTKRLSSNLVRSGHQFQGFIIQYVQSYKYLKAVGYARSFQKRLVDKIKEIESTNRKIGFLGSIMIGIREPMMILAVVIIILVQIRIFNGNMGSIILSVLFLYRALGSISLIQTLYNQFLGVSGSIINIKEFTNSLFKGKEQTGRIIKQNLDSKITLSNISYFFGESKVLMDINLTIQKNETIAIVGESGSGKTTLMNIITGLLIPKNGELKFDGISNRDLDLNKFNKCIGYITQDPVIFDDTIYNNITFWSNKSEENLRKYKHAIEQADIFDFIYGMPDKEDTRLGNNGINLSGGQRQRISIARELFKKIDILCMDEATSALDSETEQTIKNNLDKLKGQLTVIIIAHRLATIKNTDRVVLLNNGRIERIGTYSELLKESESFKRMVNLQEV